MRVKIYGERGLIGLAKRGFSDILVAGETLDEIALIDITDSGETPTPLWVTPKMYLSLSFDDVVPGDGEGVPISEEQAAQIAEFVLENFQRIKILICKCTFGESRSAAVAAAVLEDFYHCGIKVFEKDRYHPNKNVYRTVLNALRKARGKG